MGDCRIGLPVPLRRVDPRVGATDGGLRFRFFCSTFYSEIPLIASRAKVSPVDFPSGRADGQDTSL
jgi:hypothetical protein